MIPCLTRAGIGNPGNLESFVALAGRHGFGGVDAGGDELLRLMEARGGAEGARAYLAEHGVRIGSIGLPVEWRKDEDSFRAGLARLAAHAEAAAALGCTRCCTYILPSTDEEPARYAARTARRLRTCARILAPYGLRLGLEFVGPHHLRRRWAHVFFYDLPGTLELIGDIGEPNVGLLLDSYHWYTTGGTVADLEGLRPEQIVHVHINDAKPVPVEEALDNDRLFPGEGVIDLAGFLGALQRIGYDGFVSLEVLSQSPPPAPPEEMAARAREAYRRVWPSGWPRA